MQTLFHNIIDLSFPCNYLYERFSIHMSPNFFINVDSPIYQFVISLLPILVLLCSERGRRSVRHWLRLCPSKFKGSDYVRQANVNHGGYL